MSKSAAYLAGLIVTTSASAAPVTLTGAAIRDLLTGRTLNLDTPLGSSLPVALNDDGSMTGKAGDLGFYLGSDKDQGKWWTKGSRLCQKWNRWLYGAENCMRIKQDGETLTWLRDDGMSGTARLMPEARPKPLLPAVLTATPSAKVPAPYALGGPRPETEDYEDVSPSAASTSVAALASPAVSQTKAPPEHPPVIKQDHIARLELGELSRAPADDVRKPVTDTAWPLPLRFEMNPDTLAGLVRARRVAPEADWCRDHANAAPSRAPLPNLFLEAAAGLGSDTMEPPKGSCVGAQPSLQELSRLLVSAPQVR